MPTDKNWRDIIHRYLEACREDQQRGARAESSSYHVLMSFGSSRLIRNLLEFRTVGIKRTEQPLGPMEGYTLIEGSDNLVVAEVDRCENGQPFFQSRFRLVFQDDAWFLDDVYWACHCGNGKCSVCDDGKCKCCSEGKCSKCDGNGTCRSWVFFTHSCIFCKGTGSCLLCRGKGICNLCEGLGRCRSCADSDMPGWASMFRKRSTKSEKKS